MKLINALCEKGRVFECSVIFISHVDTHARKTALAKDLDIYVTSQNNLENNRMIEHYLKLRISPDDINKGAYYVVFNRNCEYVITNKLIEKFDSFR
jgi:hypothetical protein